MELDQQTQSDDPEIHNLTKLPERKASAVRAADIYLLRHEIEHVFYLSTTTLTCEVKGLNYPLAALFLFCTAMIAINCRFVLLAAVAAANGRRSAKRSPITAPPGKTVKAATVCTSQSVLMNVNRFCRKLLPLPWNF